VQETVAQLITNKVIESAHDLSDGGLFVTLAESAMPRQLGFSIKTDAAFRKDAFLFGEAQSRVLVSVSASKQTDFEEVIGKTNVRANFLGKVTKENFTIDSDTIMTCATAKDLFEKTLPAYMA
jgi:phosphoribosylformylglycinamidine synthase subunit PurL